MSKIKTLKIAKVADFHKCVQEFFENFHGDDLWCGGMNCKLYTMDEWVDRGERYYGYQCSIEGFGGDGEWSFHNEFTEFCNKHGYYWEMGYSWTVHFYEC